jgi:hypothetical protein
LNTLIPLTIGALGVPQTFSQQSSPVAKRQWALFGLWWECTAWGTLGLVPLLYEPRELLLKGTSLTAYLAAFYSYYYYSLEGNVVNFTLSANGLASIRETTTVEVSTKHSLAYRLVANVPVGFHIFALLLVWIQVDMLPTRFFGRWELVPLALTSLSCATALLVSFARLTFYMVMTDTPE